MRVFNWHLSALEYESPLIRIGDAEKMAGRIFCSEHGHTFADTPYISHAVLNPAHKNPRLPYAQRSGWKTAAGLGAAVLFVPLVLLDFWQKRLFPVLGTRHVYPAAVLPKSGNWSPFDSESIAAAFASLRNPPIRFCNVRRPIPSISAARLRSLFTYSITRSRRIASVEAFRAHATLPGLSRKRSICLFGSMPATSSFGSSYKMRVFF